MGKRPSNKKKEYTQIQSTNDLTRYHKLVRDKIPEICLKDGKVPLTRELTSEELKDFLVLKLKEESNEYFESREIEELGDVLEVIKSLAKLYSIKMSEIEERQIKREKNVAVSKKGFY